MDLSATILSVICLISVFITFGLGIAAYTKNPQSSVNRLFLLMMCSASYWAFGEFMIWQAGSYNGVLFWLKFSSFWPFVLGFTLHFILVFTRPAVYDRYPALIAALIYIPSALISCAVLFTDWIFTVGIPSGSTQYTYLPVIDSPVYHAEAVYLLVLMLVAVLVIAVFQRHATTPNLKNQARLLCAGLSTVISCGILSAILLPALSICIPNLVFIGIVIFSVLITVAMRNHDLFVLSPATAVPEIMRTMPDAMILADTGGIIISTNDSAGRLLGTGTIPLDGRAVSSCIPDEVFTRIRAMLLANGRVTDVETIPPGAPSRVVSIAGSRVLGPSGDPAGMVLIIRDITDRKTAETALMTAGRKISLLTQVTRHDINNLVSALGGYLVLMKDNPSDPARETYLNACMEITGKISNQLRFTREYQEIGSHEPAWSDLEDILSRARSDLPGKNDRIHADIVDSEIFADPMIVKVFYNIIENSFRHGKHVSWIRITAAAQQDGTLRIVIEDDGIGIRAEDKENIFRYGFGKNTGLGLAVSRDILSLTGITIAETGTEGSGARFEVDVPPSAWRRYPGTGAGRD